MSTEKDLRRSHRRENDNRLLRSEMELDAVQRISLALSQHIRIDDLAEKILHTALEVVDADAGSLLLADFESKTLVFRHVIGPVADILIGKSIPWAEGISGAVFQTGEPQIIADVKLDPRHYSDIDKLTGYKTHDMISMPLKRWGGEPIGVFNVLNKRNGPLGKSDVAILTIISAISAQTVEQARLFEEAKLAEISRILGDIGHDIKNMLQPVLTGAGLLRNEINELFSNPSKIIDLTKTKASYELCNEVLGMLFDSTYRINDRVREISDCVKGLSAPPQFGPCNVVEVVDSVIRTLSLLAQEREISLNTERLDALPTIVADERRIYNAFFNLVNNAIPEVPSGGSITINGKADEAAGVVILSVADTGRGMPPEVQKSLFSARAISRKPGGTGLGTKIVKDVVDAHHGQITVQSEEGVGTTFLIHLPIQQQGASAGKTP